MTSNVTNESPWCFEYNADDTGSFGDCCDSLGVVPKPWWWYLVLTVPVEYALVFFREKEDGSIGERKSRQENIVFSIITVIGVAPIITRLVIPFYNDDYEMLCDGGWNCYQAFVYSFANSAVLLTCLTLWVRLKFKRYFPVLVRAAQAWIVNPMFTTELSITKHKVFMPFKMIQRVVCRADKVLFLKFHKSEEMDELALQGTDPAYEHYFALLVICGGGGPTHVVPAFGAYLWIFLPFLFMLLISHALRVGLLQDRTLSWTILNIPCSVIFFVVHLVLTVFMPLIFFANLIGVIVAGAGLAVYRVVSGFGLFFWRLPTVIAYARARRQMRHIDPAAVRRKLRHFTSRAKTVEELIESVSPVIASMRALVRNELEKMVEKELQAINAEPDENFAGSLPRQQIINSRKAYAHDLDNRIILLERDLLMAIEWERVGHVQGEAAPTDPFESRIRFMIAALFFRWEFTLLTDDLALLRRDLSRRARETSQDRLAYVDEVSNQLKLLESMPKPYLDIDAELQSTRDKWESERDDRNRIRESKLRESQESFLEEEGMTADEYEDDSETSSYTEGFTKGISPIRGRLSFGRASPKKSKKKKKEPSKDSSSAPSKPLAPLPIGGIDEETSTLESAIQKEWDSNRRQTLSAAGFLGGEVEIKGPLQAKRADRRQKEDMEESSSFAEEQHKQTHIAKAAQTLKEFLKQLKQVILFDALGDVVMLGTAFCLICFGMATNYSLLLYSGAPYIDIPEIEFHSRGSSRVIDCYTTGLTGFSWNLSALSLIDLVITLLGLLMSLIFGFRFIILVLTEPALFCTRGPELQTLASAV